MTDMREWDSRDRRIAAEALRQAAEMLDAFPKGGRHNEYVRGLSVAIVYLSGCADELEGK